MKKSLILAGFATIALSCNNNPNSNTNHNDSTNHAVHHSTASDIKNKKNAMTEIMDKMMHEMQNAKPTGNNDIDFAVMMVDHHKGAVDMSKVETIRK